MPRLNRPSEKPNDSVSWVIVNTMGLALSPRKHCR